MSKPTIEEVASHAGVARGTVSRVLNGGSVAPATKAKVLASIEAIGYTANPHAQSLASGRNNVFAAVLTEPYGELFEDPTFSMLLRGINGALVGTDIGLSLVIASTDDERRRAVRMLDIRRVDGMIYLSPHAGDSLLAQVQPQLPVVLCGGIGRDQNNTWCIRTDDALGGRLGAEYLLTRRPRQVAIIAGPVDGIGAQLRLAGQLEVLGDGADPDLIIHAPYHRQGGEQAAETLLQTERFFDALLCASDRQAAGAITTLQRHGFAVPDDVRVMGYDGHPFGARMRPRLTTISQPIVELGRRAVAALEQVLVGQAPERTQVLPVELTLGESA